jgi:hypothetical protein
MLRVSIPPGAAILPWATRDGTAAGNEAEVWLPRNGLARIQVTRSYTYETLRGQAPSALNRDLAALTADAPQAGSPQVTAPAWAWTEAEISQRFLSGGEPIEAGWLFLSPGHHPAAEGMRLAHHIPGQAGEASLVFSIDPAVGRPALGGRPATPGEFARALRALVAQHPELNQPVFRLAGAVSQQYVQELADITGRTFAAADSPVYFAAAGLLAGTMIATWNPAVRGAPTGRWYLYAPGAVRRELSIDLTHGSGSREPSIHLAFSPPTPQAASASGSIVGLPVPQSDLDRPVPGDGGSAATPSDGASVATSAQLRATSRGAFSRLHEESSRLHAEFSSWLGSERGERGEESGEVRAAASEAAEVTRLLDAYLGLEPAQDAVNTFGELVGRLAAAVRTLQGHQPAGDGDSDGAGPAPAPDPAPAAAPAAAPAPEEPPTRPVQWPAGAYPRAEEDDRR